MTHHLEIAMFKTEAHVKQFVHQVVTETIAFAKTQNWIGEDLDMVVRMSASQKRKRSWGGSSHGRGYINLAVYKYVDMMGQSFNEYSSFAKDPEIGSVPMGPVQNALMALVLHEMAHVFEYKGTNEMRKSFGAADGNVQRGHGTIWKNIYRVLRNKYLNGKVVELPAYVAPVKVVTEKQKNTISRSEAAEIIHNLTLGGSPRKEVINILVGQYGFKATTASTYYNTFRAKVIKL